MGSANRLHSQQDHSCHSCVVLSSPALVLSMATCIVYLNAHVVFLLYESLCSTWLSNMSVVFRGRMDMYMKKVGLGVLGGR